MRLILIRHGIAEDQEAFAKSGEEDSLRPLTRSGRRKMKLAANGLRKLLPKIDLLATSPFKRAAQTAGIIFTAYKDEPQFVELPLLATAHPLKKLVEWLNSNNGPAGTIALVGHEPSLSRLAGWFTGGREKSIVTLKKGAACIIDFPGRVAAGKGVLHGLFQPGDLRRQKMFPT